MSALWAALPWLAPFLTIPWLARGGVNLARAPRRGGRLVSVIIPARNEAATLETVVRSVLATTYAPVEVIVVDDRSTDATLAIAERLAAEDARVRVVRGADPPPGWFGKPWACAQGWRAARGELLAFTDADTRHAPDLLPHAVGALEHQGVDLLTAITHQRCETFWERVVMPQVWFLLGLRFPPHQVNRARHPRDVVANGQFILVRREAYEAVGTHELVRREVAEDVALAQEFVRRGRKLVIVRGQSLIETRMYRSLDHLIEGWSKNVYLGGRRSYPDEPVRRALVPLMLVVVMSFWLLPLAGLAAAGLAGPAAHSWLGPSALAATMLSAAFWSMMSAGMRIKPAYGLAYPLGTAVVLYIVARSTWRGSRHVEWKGRVYRPGPSEPV